MTEQQDGIKHDDQKPKVEFLSTLWILGVGDVLRFGAAKYAAHNWRKGLSRSRLLGAALRHVLAYLGGEDNDKESGLPHLHHASCCLMFASELHVTRPDLDDRYKVKAPGNVTIDEFEESLKFDPVQVHNAEHCWYCDKHWRDHYSLFSGELTKTYCDSDLLMEFKSITDGKGLCK